MRIFRRLTLFSWMIHGLWFCIGSLLSLSCISVQVLTAQTPAIDSLRTALRTASPDSVRSTVLARLMWEERTIDPVQAIIYGREAQQLVENENNPRKRSEIYRFLGVAYRNAGDLAKAAELVHKSLSIDEERGDSVQIAHSLNTLGRIMLLQNNVGEATVYIHRAVTLAEQMKDEALLAFCLFTLADLHFTSHEYALALATAEKVVVIRARRGEDVYVADVYLAIAKALATMMQYDKAYDYISKALAIFERKRITYNLAVGNNAMATLLLTMKKPTESVSYANNALQIANTIGAKVLEKEAALLLSESYTAEGKFQAALEMYKRHKILSDSIFSERSIKQNALLNIEYETKNKEQQIRVFEQERRFNALLTVVVAIIIALLVTAFLWLVGRYKRQSEGTQHLQARAESLADANDVLRMTQMELQESHQKLSEALRQIQVTNDELQDLNEEKNMILGMVSHDLKNPIVAIQGLAEMMNTEMFTLEQYKEFSGVILGTSNRMYALVKNFLDVARAEEGRLRLTFIRFDIAEVIDLVLDNYRQQAENKNITIHYDKPTSAMVVRADESVIIQVLDNLISNALKYTPPGKNVNITVEMVHVVKHNEALVGDAMDNLSEESFDECVRFSIIDEGPGLTDSDKSQLFHKFARLSAQPTGGESSTGLGLAITKQLVELMNGRVWCESEYGYGARFIVEFPAVQG